MINIKQKAVEKIKKEESLYAFGAAVVKGIKKSVCPTYVVFPDRTKKDTDKLKENEIML